jgi:uracil-DNA glycosylase
MKLYNYIYENIPKGWEDLFMNAEPEIQQISDILDDRASKGKRIVPEMENIFRVFNMIQPKDLKVILFGMDPYPQILTNGKPRALGFSFSVDKEDTIPSSLSNIYKEIKNCYPKTVIPSHGDVSHWVNQGVFLLNVCLTCEAYEPGSHSKYKLWMPFMDKFLVYMSSINKDLIFVLWGNDAKKLQTSIEKRYKNVLIGVHPSGLSANRGFIGCGHFRAINDILVKLGKEPIEWLENEKTEEEIRISIISKLTKDEELNSLSSHYLESYNSTKSKMSLQEFTIYAMTTTVYKNKNLTISYNDFLKNVQEFMDSNREKGFYETILHDF